MIYKNIKSISKERCAICHNDLSYNSSPWAVCYNSNWDSIEDREYDDFKYRGLLCQECAEELLDPRNEGIGPKYETNEYKAGDWFCLKCFNWNKQESIKCWSCGNDPDIVLKNKE